jgi:hypothetical protein
VTTCCQMPNGGRLACDSKLTGGCGCQCHWRTASDSTAPVAQPAQSDQSDRCKGHTKTPPAGTLGCLFCGRYDPTSGEARRCTCSAASWRDWHLATCPLSPLYEQSGSSVGEGR